MFSIEHDIELVAPFLSEMVRIADTERDSLGWLAPSAYKDALASRRIIACLYIEGESRTLAGFVLFGGVYPNAKVYQVCVSQAFRRGGVATKLMNELVKRLEVEGYLSISARIANDLVQALSFYSSNGFVPVREIAGGVARERKLTIYARQLATADLFYTPEPSRADLLALALRSSNSNRPFYVIDLNVLLDLVRDRQRTPDARRLFGAALGHQVRVVVSSEFEAELRRTSSDPNNDPLLQMALQLPRLPNVSGADFTRMSEAAHRIVFANVNENYARSPQSISDARHIAHAAAGKAAAYITSDTAILAAAERLRSELGIDVASLADLVDLLPDDLDRHTPVHTTAETGFSLTQPSAISVHQFLESTSAQTLMRESPEFLSDATAFRWAVAQAGRIVGVSMLRPSRAIGAPADLLLHIDPTVPQGEQFLEVLYDVAFATIANAGPTLVELRLMPASFEFARARGFSGSPTDGSVRYHKVAVGRPLTARSWPANSASIARRSQIRLGVWPKGPKGDVELTLPAGKRIDLSMPQLEDLLGPTLICWDERNALIQPIRKNFADELLSTGNQLSLLSFEAAFLSQRTYVGTTRSAAKMRPGSLIFFYESMKAGGRGAVVAVARIVDTVVSSAREVDQRYARQLVVKDVGKLTKETAVLLTNFDTLMVFPRPCPLSALSEMGLVGTQNLQSATAITAAGAAQLMDFGWEP